MAAGDVYVDIVENPTTTTIDTAMTTIRSTCGANGHYGMFELNGSVIVWGIEEA